MNSRRNNLIVLSVVVTLIGVAAYFIFIRQPVAESTQLGLDLRGGVSVQLEGYQTDDSEVTRQEMEQAVSVIQQRVNSLGVTEPEVQIQGQNQVIVNIPGVTDPDRTIDIIGDTAQLSFYRVLASEGQSNVPPDEVELAEGEIEEDLKNDSAFESGKTQILFEKSPAIQGGGTDVIGYVVPNRPGLTGDALKQNGANVDYNQFGKREVALQLTKEGGRKIADLTQDMLNDALASGQPPQLAIVLDEDVQSAPQVNEPLGEHISISNDSLPEGLPEDEAEQLKTVLNTGALPVNMKVLSVTSIGPTLGADSLRSGLIAALAGFGLVLLFLLVVYRALGVVADLALLIYAFLLWGLIVAIPVTVTLPGIAGIVLSVGVAADANIVIFERIKEEIRRGKTPRTAIQTGYQKGFRAILDGNITTLITAFILFALSSGSVRGFAVLLSIGVVLSMFTAIVVTRALLGAVSGRGFHLSPGMMGVSKKEIRTGGR
jgi:preprotein translocase subunit SecD